MSFNSTYKIPKDASYVTLRNQNRMLYANYSIQQYNVRQGCQVRAELQNGGVADADMIPKLLEGAIATTVTERDAEIASGTCVVTIPPVIVINYNTDVLTFARRLNTLYGGATITPTSGGALTINSQSVGNYEYTSRSGNTTISSFVDSDWFSSTEDTVSSWIIVNGNLTINTGQTVIPTKRKLFTLIYVNGNLTVNGSISMTGRGANHSGTGSSGGYTAPVDILLASGTYSSVTDPQIPGTGGAGGAKRSTIETGNTGYNSGTDGTAGGTGGGSSGPYYTGSGGSSGAGATGTCFSGGGGGGGTANQGGQAGQTYIDGTNAGANGGAGGDAGYVTPITGYTNLVPGGPGNPGGKGRGPGGTLNASYDGNAGTAGVIIILCEGSLSGTGSIVSSAAAVNSTAGFDGAGGGGGSINVFYKTNPASAVTVTAAKSGRGGNGTARKLALP